MTKRLGASLLGAALLASCASLQAPEPQRRPALSPSLEMTSSTVELRLNVPHDLPSWNEKSVPAAVSGQDSAMRTLSAWFLKHDWHYWWSYSLDRSPMALSFVDNKVRVSTTITGTLKGWWDTLPGESVADVRAEAGVEAVLTLEPGWSVRAVTQPYLEVEHAEVPVGITWDGAFFGETISIAAPVRETLRPALTELGTGLAATVNGWEVRSALESAWREAQSAASLGGERWLALRPEGLVPGPLRPTVDGLEASVQVTLRPEIGRGPRSQSISALPQGLADKFWGGRGSELSLNLPVTLDWKNALAVTQDRWLTKQPWTAENGSKVRLTHLEASTDGAQVLLKARAVLLPPWPSAETEAEFWITGQLATGPGAQVSLRNLALEPASRRFLEAKTPWLGKPTWLPSLEAALVWDLRPQAEDTSVLVRQRLDRLAFGPHLTLTAEPESTMAGPPFLAEQGPTIVVRLTGPARLTWTP